jgi:hypothetical protein
MRSTTTSLCKMPTPTSRMRRLPDHRRSTDLRRDGQGLCNTPRITTRAKDSKANAQHAKIRFNWWRWYRLVLLLRHKGDLDANRPFLSAPYCASWNVLQLCPGICARACRSSRIACIRMPHRDLKGHGSTPLVLRRYCSAWSGASGSFTGARG